MLVKRKRKKRKEVSPIDKVREREIRHETEDRTEVKLVFRVQQSQQSGN